MSKAAFSERKRRGSFPEDKLRALAQRRPDLALNIDYVLTGEHKPAQNMAGFAQRLRQAREQAGLSEAALADLAGLAVVELRAIESGAVEPTPAARKALLDVAEIDGQFVVVGTPTPGFTPGLSQAERALLAQWRSASPAAQKRALAALSSTAAPAAPKGVASTPKARVHQDIGGTVMGDVAGRDVVKGAFNDGSPTKGPRRR